MSVLSEEDKHVLLTLARSAITAKLVTDAAVRRPARVSALLQEKRGCFVTLHQKGALRGCIGVIEPRRSLLVNVEENACNAAFRDPRFPPVTLKELDDIDIEISVLTPPRPLSFRDPEDLLDQLQPGVHGVILSQGMQRATFLPQVWEQLPQKKEFLEQLCRKGGMAGSCWRQKETRVEVYEVEYFGEKDGPAGCC